MNTYDAKCSLILSIYRGDPTNQLHPAHHHGSNSYVASWAVAFGSASCWFSGVTAAAWLVVDKSIIGWQLAGSWLALSGNSR